MRQTTETLTTLTLVRMLQHRYSKLQLKPPETVLCVFLYCSNSLLTLCLHIVHGFHNASSRCTDCDIGSCSNDFVRTRGLAAFTRMDTTKLSCGEKLEYALDQERRRLRVVGRQ